ncbi:hypothetical protein [Aerosakkonema funiforme]|uniref:Uncharacterized protein n=1 Tax=Aerosakkonema funiforme FACHB-1375 TaxID=2949571 RepID=A0A926VKX6_9CYAN|nr:hypothetical protein [Aerosakkonema funiforme]MBD2185644.1 hypothetical protein [Aerosakkonema funiforme FACHB-1375]
MYITIGCEMSGLDVFPADEGRCTRMNADELSVQCLFSIFLVETIADFLSVICQMWMFLPQMKADARG